MSRVPKNKRRIRGQPCSTIMWFWNNAFNCLKAFGNQLFNRCLAGFWNIRKLQGELQVTLREESCKGLTL